MERNGNAHRRSIAGILITYRRAPNRKAGVIFPYYVDFERRSIEQLLIALSGLMRWKLLPFRDIQRPVAVTLD